MGRKGRRRAAGLSRHILRQGERRKQQKAQDEGQSDAINKGFRRARGEIVAWLNADDVYFPWTVRTAVEALRANPAAGMIYGATDVIDAAGRTVRKKPAEPFDLQRLLDEGLGHAGVRQPLGVTMPEVVEADARMAGRLSGLHALVPAHDALCAAVDHHWLDDTERRQRAPQRDEVSCRAPT